MRRYLAPIGDLEIGQEAESISCCTVGKDTDVQKMSRGTCLVFVLGVTLFIVMLSSCVVYEPYYYPASQYDRVWESAIRAAEEAGIVVSAAERDKGTITGSKGPVDVTIAVLTQADGRIRVHMSARGPEGAEPYLTERFNQAYQRYMGR